MDGEVQTFTVFNLDLPDNLRPATAVGLSGNSIVDREIGKNSFCSVEGLSGRCQAMMLPEPTPVPPQNFVRFAGKGLALLALGASEG